MQETKQSSDTHITAPTLYTTANGIKYAYRSWGKPSDIPLILLQHITGTMDDWDPLITDGLSKNHRIVIFDNAGVGSSGGKTPETIVAMAENATSFIFSLGYKIINLLGYSLGGFVAQQIIIDHPGLVRRAILAGTGPEGGDKIEELQTSFRDASKISPASPKLYLFFTQTPFSQKRGEAFMQRLELRTEDRDKTSSKESITAQFAAMIAWGNNKDPAYPRLKKIQIPVLVVNGSDDIMIPTINSFILFKHLPNAQLSLYPDSAHGSLFQYPGLFLEQANYFLSGQ